MKRLLLIEDDQSFGYILSEYLSLTGFHVDWVTSGEDGLKQMTNNLYNLAILDIMLPGIDGFELARQLKQKYPETPFLFLSAKSLKIDRLKGFKLGACDYLTKPVDEELLVAKINALINLSKKENIQHKGEYGIGKYQFIPSLFQLKIGNEIIKLTARETELLRLLCDHKDQLLTRKKALLHLWGSNDEFSRKSMDVFVSHLRKYLSEDPQVSIENVHRQGFILKC